MTTNGVVASWTGHLDVQDSGGLVLLLRLGKMPLCVKHHSKHGSGAVLD